MDDYQVVTTTQISPEHPSLPGHFPGQPVVPGVVTLSLVESALGQWLDQPVNLVEAPMIKFHRPVLPGQALEIAFKSLSEASAGFMVRSEGVSLMEGKLKYALLSASEGEGA